MSKKVTGIRQPKKLTKKEQIIVEGVQAQIDELNAKLDQTVRIVDRLSEALFGNKDTGSTGLITAYDNIDTRSLAQYRIDLKKQRLTEDEFLEEVRTIQQETEALKMEAQFNRMGFAKEEGSSIGLGDLVIFSSNATVDGQKFDGSVVKNAIMVVGSQEPFAGFGDKFSGKLEGDTLDFVVDVPADYAMESIKGKKVRYQCEIRTVRKPIKQAQPEVVKEETEVSAE